MTTRTKSMTHFVNAADGLIAAQMSFNKVASGLAGDMFEGAKLLAEESEGKKLVLEFDKAMIDVENARKIMLVELTGDEKMTLTKYCSAWKSRKSDLRTGIEAGVDPAKFETFSQFRKASVLKKSENANGGAPDNGGSKDNNGGGDTPPQLNTVPNGLDPAVQKQLNILLGSLDKLSTEGQEKLINASIGELKRLEQLGGRWVNVSKKTA